MRDVNYGWLIRYLHANGASFFFILVYCHIGRNLYYGSYKAPRVMPWTVGVIMLVLMMGIAFLGYLYSQKWCKANNVYLVENSLYYLSVLPFTLSERCHSVFKSYNLEPEAVFENLHIQGVKATVCTSIKPLAGVYVIINLITGDMYVGSAITGRMPIRFHKHLYGMNGSKLVAVAVAKYGLANFAFVVVETLPNIVTTQQDNKSLLAMEDYYISLLAPRYNIAPQAGNTFGVTHTEVTKRKMQMNYSPERREQIGSINRGNKLSSATVERIRAAALARPPMTDETRQKISANSTVAIQFEVSRLDKALMPNGCDKVILRTMRKVAEFCSCSPKTVQRALGGTGIVKNTWHVTAIGKANNL